MVVVNVSDVILFNAFRYFIIPTDQISVYQMQLIDKKEIMHNFFKTIEEQLKITKYIKDKKHILYFTHRFSDTLYLCKYVKEINFKNLKEGETDILEENESNFPFVFLIFDLNRQIILVQQKTSLFRNLNAFKNSFENWFMLGVEMYDHYFKLEAITYEQAFWNYVNSAEAIYELELLMNSPNLFGGKVTADSILKEIKDEYNNTETQLKFRNTKGKLKVTHSNAHHFIKYITGGGGSWKLRIHRNNKIRTYNSSQNVKKVELPYNIDQMKNEIKVTIQSELSKIDEIMEDG